MEEVLWIVLGIVAVLYVLWLLKVNSSSRVAGASGNITGGRGKPILRWYTTTWCGACKAFAPRWNQLVPLLAGKVEMQKMDCTEPTQAAIHLKKVFKDGKKLTGYPTLTVQIGNDEEEIFDRSGFATVEQMAEKLKTL